MAFSVATLTSGVGATAFATSHVTASVTPTVATTLLLTVGAHQTAGTSTLPSAPTVTGLGLTWELIGSVAFDEAGVDQAAGFLFAALVTVSTPGAVTITHANSEQYLADWVLDQVSGAAMNSPAVQVVTAVTTGTSSISATLPAFIKPTHLAYAAVIGQNGTDHTWGGGWTEAGAIADGFTYVGTAYFEGDTSRTATASWLTTTYRTGLIAVEIREPQANRALGSFNFSATSTFGAHPDAGPLYIGMSSGFTATATATAAIPTGVQAGDLLLAYIAHTSSTVTVSSAPAGWSILIPDANPSDFTTIVYSRVYQAGDPDPTWTWSATGNTCVDIVAYRFVGSVAATSMVKTNSATDTATATATITPPVDGTLVVGYAVVDVASGTRTWTVTGLTERVDNFTNPWMRALADGAGPGAGVQLSTTWTHTGSIQDAVVFLAALAGPVRGFASGTFSFSGSASGNAPTQALVPRAGAAAGALPSLVGVVTATATAADIVLSAPIGVQAGDIQIVLIGVAADDEPITDPPAGWTEVGTLANWHGNPDTTGATHWAGVWISTTDTQPATFHRAISSGNRTMFAFRAVYRGANGWSSGSLANTINGVSQTKNHPIPAVATDVWDLVVAGLFTEDASLPTFTPPAGFTERLDERYNDVVADDPLAITLADRVSPGGSISGQFTSDFACHGTVFSLLLSGAPIVWSGTSTGARIAGGSVSRTVTWTTTTSGRRELKGAATGAHSWSATTAATRAPKGAATGASAWTATTSGTRVPKGAVTRTTSWAATTSGGRTSLGAAARSVSWNGTTSGVRAPKGTAARSVSWGGTASGVWAPKGAATGANTWTGTAQAVSPYKGAATGSHKWVTAATSAGGRAGSTTGTASWTTTTSGTRVPKGAAAGTDAWTATTQGRTARAGAATSTHRWTGLVTSGAAKTGSAAGGVGWTCTTSGVRRPRGASVAGAAWACTATGQHVDKGAATGAVTWACTASGSKPTSTGSCAGTHLWTGTARSPLSVRVDVTVAVGTTRVGTVSCAGGRVGSVAAAGTRHGRVSVGATRQASVVGQTRRDRGA